MRRRDFFKGMAASVAATTVANAALGQQAPATPAANTTVPPLAAAYGSRASAVDARSA